jgi:APA family basic amino acid/polyamine antiporter
VSDRNGGARRLGLVSAAALVIGNMIGAGVFTTSGFALADVGRREWVLLAWLVGGLLAMCGALSYGALARRIPESGGEYTFLSQTIHPLAGFVAGWISLVAGFTAPIAAAALGLQAYLVGSGGDGVRPEWIGSGAILVTGLMHGLRLREGVVLQNLAIGLKLLAIAVLVAFAAGRLPAPDLEPSGSASFELGAFAVTLVWISFAYSGWNAAVYVAGEVRDPGRNVSRSLVLATLLVTGVYLALNAVFLCAAPASAIAGKAEVGAIAAEAIGGPRLRQAVSVLVALALFTSISAMVMAGPRVYARMAEDGLFPRIFGTGRGVPGRAVALQVGLAILVLWYSDLARLLGYIGFTLGLSAAATVAGLIAIRLREGRERVPIPGYPWIPGLFIFVTLGTAGFMIVRQPGESLMGLLTVAVGALLYFAIRSRRS